MKPTIAYRRAHFAALGSLVSFVCIGQTAERQQNDAAIVTRANSTFELQTTPAVSATHVSSCAKNPIVGCPRDLVLDTNFTTIPIKGGTNSMPTDVRARMTATELNGTDVQAGKPLSAGAATIGK